MAQHRAPRTTHHVRTFLLTIAAFIGALFIVGAVASAHTPEQSAPAAPALPVCSSFEVSMADIAHAHGLTLRLACEDAESLGVDQPATVTADPATVTSTPAPVTTTLAPAVETSTPAPVTEIAAPATVTEDAAPVTVTADPETVTVQAAPVTETETATVTETQTATATVAAPAAPTMAPCTMEDGSAPGQTFPCHWDAAHQGNGQGQSYDLAEPAGAGSGYVLPGN